MILALLLFILFISIITFTLCGNLFVLVLSLLARKLPSPVNCCYVSLAVADIMVAAFAMTSKVIDFGLHSTDFFGEQHHHEEETAADVAATARRNIVCDVHHFLRLFSCTASILHVCIVAIERCRSLDKPFGYMMRASYKATILELVVVWTASLLASGLSAIWMYGDDDDDDHHFEILDYDDDVAFNYSSPSLSAEKLRDDKAIEGDCVYPASAFYLVGSSLISFYIPLSVMFAFYCKIYLMARRQLVMLEGEGRMTMPSKSPSGNWRYLSFRMHRGRAAKSKTENPSNSGTTKNQQNAESNSTSPATSRKNEADNNVEEISRLGNKHERLKSNSSLAHPSLSAEPSSEIPPNEANFDDECDGKNRSRTRSSVLRLAAAKARKASTLILPKEKKPRYPTIERLVTSFTPLGRSELYKKWQYYVNENKAVRTLGLLLFVFVSCWSPYFALNLTFAALGRSNVPHSDTLFNTFIWLGFLNSAFNPMLYALSAKEYKQGVCNLLRTFGLMRNPSATSTASTLSSRLAPNRLRRGLPNGPTFYQRRRNELTRTILAFQTADQGTTGTAIIETTGSLHPCRLNSITAEITKKSPTLLQVAANFCADDDDAFLADDLTYCENNNKAVTLLQKPAIPTSKSLQQIDLSGHKKSGWAGYFIKNRRSLQKMTVVTELSTGHAVESVDSDGAVTPGAVSANSEPGFVYHHSSTQETPTQQQLKPGTLPKRTYSLANYKRKPSGGSTTATSRRHFVKNSKSVQKLDPVAGMLTTSTSTTGGMKASTSTASINLDAPHIAEKLIENAISACLQELMNDEQFVQDEQQNKADQQPDKKQEPLSRIGRMSKKFKQRLHYSKSLAPVRRNKQMGENKASKDTNSSSCAKLPMTPTIKLMTETDQPPDNKVKRNNTKNSSTQNNLLNMLTRFQIDDGDDEVVVVEPKADLLLKPVSRGSVVVKEALGRSKSAAAQQQKAGDGVKVKRVSTVLTMPLLLFPPPFSPSHLNKLVGDIDDRNNAILDKSVSNNDNNANSSSIMSMSPRRSRQPRSPDKETAPVDHRRRSR